jgi:hypothetical protein
MSNMGVLSFDGSSYVDGSKITIPEAILFIKELSEFDSKFLVGGSFADYLYISNFSENIEGVEFNDLDLTCSNIFIDNISKKNNLVFNYIKNFRSNPKSNVFLFHNDIMELASKTPQVVFFDGFEYPPQIKGIWKNKNIDCFFAKTGSIDSIDVYYFGIKFKIPTLEQRIISLNSMLNLDLDEDWLKYKKKIISKKVEQLIEIKK